MLPSTAKMQEKLILRLICCSRIKTFKIESGKYEFELNILIFKAWILCNDSIIPPLFIYIVNNVMTQISLYDNKMSCIFVLWQANVSMLQYSTYIMTISS